MSPIDTSYLIERGLPPQFKAAGGFMLFNIAWTFIFGEITSNYSQVDRVWTFLPVLYSLLYTFFPLLDAAPYGLKQQGVAPRAVLMCALQIIWSFRLSYQANRRGFFTWDSEDYRWIVFKEKVPKWPITKYAPQLFFTLFNIGFLAAFQNILLAGLGILAYGPSVDPTPLSWKDGALALAIVAAILSEGTADNQQQAFQKYKSSHFSEGGVYDPKDNWVGSQLEFTPADAQRGFVTRGLWAWSRHPNCASDQTIWLLFAAFVPVTHPHLFGNAVDTLAVFSPALLLCGLFLSSTAFTEWISSSKYPAYSKYYKRRVAMFWPWETLLKQAYLLVTGQLKEVDQGVFGATIPKAIENGGDKKHD